MIKLETHCHTGASGCADTPLDVIATRYVEAGYGGVVCTNHQDNHEYNRGRYIGVTDKDKQKFFVDVYENTKKVLNSYGLKTFFSCEVWAKNEQHSEFIIYGITPEIFLKYDFLFRYTQKELFEICKAENMFMYKTHPFRVNEYAGDPKYMHGAEYFNGHYHHESNNHLAREFCEKNNLIKMSGTDFHHAGQPITGGIYIPDDINSEFELKEYVASGKAELITDYETYEKSRKLVIEGKMW